MKRDMDLARELLLRIEAEDAPVGSAMFLSVFEPPLKLEGESPCGRRCERAEFWPVSKC